MLLDLVHGLADCLAISAAFGESRLLRLRPLLLAQLNQLDPGEFQQLALFEDARVRASADQLGTYFLWRP